jgi:hypothetical protein
VLAPAIILIDAGQGSQGQYFGGNMQPTTFSRLLRWLRALPLLAPVAASYGIVTVAQAQTETISMEATSTRPVAEAIQKLTSQYGLVITYEDPRYEYPADIKDVTEQVRNPSNSRAQTSTNRVLVPNGGSLQVSYEAIVGTDGRPADVRNTLQQILNANDASPLPGRFRIEQVGDVFHVIPTLVRDGDGNWAAQTSVLDTRITLPREHLRGDQMLEAITEAISEATGLQIGLGLGSVNPYTHFEGDLEAHNEIARNVLLRTLHAIDDRFSWRLLYGPDVKSYALNVRAVGAKTPERSPTGLPARDPANQTSPVVLSPEGRRDEGQER